MHPIHRPFFCRGDTMNLKTFYINSLRIQYQEAQLEDSIFDKCYLIENVYNDSIVAIPDGGLDFQFVWENGVCRGYICGSFLKSKFSKISTYQKCFGLKLHPGTLFTFMEQNAIPTFIENRIPLGNFLNISHLEALLMRQSSFPDMIHAALQFFHQLPLFPSHYIANCAADMILASSGATRISDMVERLGYSHRYVNNIFKSHFGISTKKYAEIVRAQAAIDSLPANSVMDVVENLGYYDQAHFIRAFKDYTSLTPKSFLEQLHKKNGAIIV